MPVCVTIILDNAIFHCKKKLSVIMERVGVFLLFLPAYSPDFNRIENRWANMKTCFT
ncbi:MAG: transposase [Nitrososphaerota archaeon]|nr:transposase [Nitrososphaerota archaeon]